MINYKCQ